MVEECDSRGYGQACKTLHSISGEGYELELQRWSRRVYQALRGERACPRGLEVDRELGYCVQPSVELEGGEMSVAEAFGPFPKALVERCFSWGGGNACASGRWSLALLRGLLQ